MANSLSWISGGIPSTLLNNLVAYWKLNESSGSTRIDSLGVSNLSDNNTVTSGPGVISNSAIFSNASGNFLSVADNSALSMGAGVRFTIAGWFNLTTFTENLGFLSKWLGNPGMREYHIYVVSAGVHVIRFGVRGADDVTNQTVDAATFGALPTATWLFFCCYYDGVNIGISVNNGSFDTSPFTADVQDGTSDFNLGTSATLDPTLDCKLDEIGIWKRVLTSGEITTLYNGGAGKTYPF